MASSSVVILQYFKEFQKNPVLPFGLHCLMSAARRQGFEHQVLEVPESLHTVAREWVEQRRSPAAEDLEAVAARPEWVSFLCALADLDPQVVGITAYEDYINVVELLIRLVRPHTDAYVVLGGPLPTAMGGAVLDFLSADFAFLGEAEFLWPRFLKGLGDWRPSCRPAAVAGEGLHQLRSLVIRGVSRPPDFYQPARLEERELEAFPLDFAFALDFLRDRFPDYSRAPALTYISSRGCPYSCIFCSALQGKRFRALSASRLLEDLGTIQRLARDRFPSAVPFTLAFGDDNFLYDRRRALTFFREVAARGWQEYFQFSLLASIDKLFADLARNRVDEELLSALARAGVRSITFGTDNFCEAELRRLKKPPYRKQNIATLVEALESYGIYNLHFCILSNVHTQPEDIRENFETILELTERYRYFLQLGPIFYLSPYVGTPIWRELERRPEWEQLRRPFFFLFQDRPPAPRLTDALLPSHPLTRDLLTALAENDPREFIRGGVPYHYDHRAALALVDDLLTGKARAAGGGASL